MSTVVSPVVPPVLPQRDHTGPGVSHGSPQVRRPLPLPTWNPRRTSSVVYGLAALDCHGRIADRMVVQALGWSAGLRLGVREVSGALSMCPDAGGTVHITNQGHPRVPAALRHRCGLVPGDRVLLAADPERSRLTIYPPPALDALLLGGEPA